MRTYIHTHYLVDACEKEHIFSKDFIQGRWDFISNSNRMIEPRTTNASVVTSLLAAILETGLFAEAIVYFYLLNIRLTILLLFSMWRFAVPRLS